MNQLCQAIGMDPNLHPMFADILTGTFKPKNVRTGLWSHSTVIGEGNKDVHCTFDVSSDGDVENLRVIGDVGEVTKYLHFTQIEELECECYDSYLIQVKEHNDGLRIDAKSDECCWGL